MKVNRKKLLAELRFVAAAAERKATIPVLTHVLWRCIDSVLHLVATNLDLTLSTSLDVEGGETVALAVPGKVSIDLLSRFAGEAVEVDIDPDKHVWRISDDASTAQLAGIKEEDFPTPPEVDGEPVEVEAERFRRAVAAVRHAVGQVESRFQLAGAATSLNGSLSMATSDGHRLAVSGGIVEHTDKLPILPIAALESAALVEGDRYTIRPGDRHWTLEAPPRRVVLRPIEGTFPDVARLVNGLVNSCPHTLTVNREAFIAAVRAADAVPDERDIAIALEIGADGVAVTKLTSCGEARMTVPGTVEGDAARLGFGAPYLLDLLESVEGEEITLHYQDPNNAIVYAEGDEYRVVMPRRV